MLPAITTMLSHIGLPLRMGEVYAFLVQKGEVAAGDIARAFALSRGTAHDILSGLVRYQLVRTKAQGRKKIFVMESPDVLHRFFCDERDRMDERVRVFESVMPMLQTFYCSSAGSSVVRYFSDEQSVTKAWNAFITLPGDLIQLTDESLFCTWDEHDHVRCEAGAREIRSIVVTDRVFLSVEDDQHAVRSITPMLIDAKGLMAVRDDRVFFRGTDENTAVEICSSALATTCRAALELAWRAAGEWGVKKEKAPPFENGGGSLYFPGGDRAK